ncbi:hypothetical protein POTOM_024534 [Populus tomentosa]|uniref:Uncharacterized protein n=1 Tax=Populus tomentosa TaxID=118781 RepID=A0A8X8CWK0_POPTO|nr:hypothetical protein POTOM_024534 [Populus tomentosa]
MSSKNGTLEIKPWSLSQHQGLVTLYQSWSLQNVCLKEMKVSPPQCFLCHHHLHIMLQHMLRNFNASHPEFQFLGLPSVTPPPLEDVLACPEHFVSIFIADHRDHVKDAIFNDALSNKSPGLTTEGPPSNQLIRTLSSLAVNYLNGEASVPPVYTVGPVVYHKGNSPVADGNQRDEIMKFLDSSGVLALWKSGELEQNRKSCERCDCEGSSEVKSKVKAMSEIERKALLEGESSFVAFETLVSLLSGNKA